jgi:nitrous oxide reductase accessory protein NosL
MAFFLIFTLLLSGFSFAKQEFVKKSTGKPEIIQTGKSKIWCPVCGMNIKMFYKTSHAVTLKGKQNRQYCSMRCLAVDYPNIKNDIEKIWVVDAYKENLIDAYKAHYVIGSKIPGTMTRISKFAFKSIKDAKDFQSKYGGSITNFKEAFEIARTSLKNDIAMTNKKKRKKMYPMGKKIYEKKCKQINPKDFHKINDLKAEIKNKNLCGNLKEKQLQAVGLYLWEIKRLGKKIKYKKKQIKVSKDEKCPVCGMFVYKYPRWAAQIYYLKDNKKMHLSFDGVKDLMKFYFSPNKWGNYKNININKIMVTDYYNQNAINGKKAFYVIGSDVFGPMGNELIPFKNKKQAEIFLKDHNGKKILTFSEITEKLVYDLDKQ